MAELVGVYECDGCEITIESEGEPDGCPLCGCNEFTRLS